MFQAFAAAASTVRFNSIGLLAGVASAAALALAAPASATVIVKAVTSTDTSIYGTIDGSQPGDNRFWFGMSPTVADLSENGKNFSVLAFCVQFYVDMPGDFNAAGDKQFVDTAYEDGSLVTLSGSDTHTATEVYNLINYGTDLWLAHSAPDLTLQLAAVQGAIWRVMTHQPVVFFNDVADFPDQAIYADKSPLIDHFVSLADSPPLDASAIRTLVTRDNSAQAIAYSLRTVVPEPGAWSLMLVGFFGAGAVLRSRRRLARPAA